MRTVSTGPTTIITDSIFGERPDRKDNLCEPLPGDHGAHGNFHAQAWDVSPEVWAVTHKAITLGSIMILGMGIALFFSKKIFLKT